MVCPLLPLPLALHLQATVEGGVALVFLAPDSDFSLPVSCVLPCSFSVPPSSSDWLSEAKILMMSSWVSFMLFFSTLAVFLNLTKSHVILLCILVLRALLTGFFSWIFRGGTVGGMTSSSGSSAGSGGSSNWSTRSAKRRNSHKWRKACAGVVSQLFAASSQFKLLSWFIILVLISIFSHLVCFLSWLW